MKRNRSIRSRFSIGPARPPTRRLAGALGAITLAGALAAGCGDDAGGGRALGGRALGGRGGDGDVQARVERTLEHAQRLIAERADSMERALRPVPLLTGAEEGALRRYLNAAQLARARQLGVDRPQSRAELEELQRRGRLVPLEDSTQHWIVRELDHSVALVTPDTRALLTEIGERFQERLDSLGLPPLRVEVTSVLRTAETQADLRQQNANAARGVSTHEYGTTLDIAYNSFAAPQEPAVQVDLPEAPWLGPHVQSMSGAFVETVAARRSRELQAILGRMLREMQDEGKVMVTMERQQPVYHITVAKRY